MSKRRTFYSGGCQHLCQISFDGSLLFCTVADRILLFSLICLYAVIYNVRITHICIMFNHFHIQAYFRKESDMSEFMSSIAWCFATIYNRKFGLGGAVFHHSYCSAPKYTSKKICSNAIYISNNIVEKHGVSSAGDYRWNFLKYSPSRNSSTGELYRTDASIHPFSEKYDEDAASEPMKKLVKEVHCKHKAGKPISYDFFESPTYKALDNKERLQILDIIISTYNVIDYEPLLQKYGTIDNYLRTLEVVEGSEYDLGDDTDREDYKHYNAMIAIAEQEGFDMRFVRYANAESMPPELLHRLIGRFRTEAGASALEIRKLLKIKDYGKRKLC